MAAPADAKLHEPPPTEGKNPLTSWMKRWTGKSSKLSVPEGPEGAPHDAGDPVREPSASSGVNHRGSRKVVPGLPRAKTFKRQQSENREKLEAIKPTPAERRAVSVDRRAHPLHDVSYHNQHGPRTSAPEFLDDTYSITTAGHTLSVPQTPVDEKQFLSLSNAPTVSVGVGSEEAPRSVSRVRCRPPSTADAQSITTSQYDAMIHDELERNWILNLSMHFRDKSKREKFFVTYREEDFRWRRVTISLDYRNAPDDSLEKDLLATKFQREKSAKIYEAIRESLQDIQFYETVTNLKLQTTEGRLHVHVVEDVNEIIHYPTVRMVQHLRCRRVRERDLVFDSHMSGFVYKVRVNDKVLIKKEIPGPDTVEEFLYEVNALNALTFSRNVIEFYGVVVDDEENVKGLLIDYASNGALIDVIYDSQEHGLELNWPTREKWARQIVQGLSDVHEAGFVQGDFTLSNIVIDDEDNAKIIDINRRGCPVGWEPPEATPLIDSNQRISMYIGVKSDLYQLGMVLWALATLEDEPEAHRRPLRLDREITVPGWYRRVVDNCLNENPRIRLQATALLAMLPEALCEDHERQEAPSISVDDGCTLQEYFVDRFEHDGRTHIRTVTPANEWGYTGASNSYVTSPGSSDDSFYYPRRGRSPPSLLPSNYEMCDSPYIENNIMWSGNPYGPSSVSDVHEIGESQVVNYQAGRTSLDLADANQSVGDTKPNHKVAPIETANGHGAVPNHGLIVDLEASTESVKMPEIVVEQADEPFAVRHVLDDSLVAGNIGDIHHEPKIDPIPKQIEGKEQNLLVVEVAESETAKLTAVAQTGDVLQEMDQSLGANSGGTKITPDSASCKRFGDSETDSSPNYTHRGVENTYPRTTEAVPPSTGESPPHRIPGELAGVGSAYGDQNDIRQPSFSDEDLGLATKSATVSQNVTSQT